MVREARPGVTVGTPNARSRGPQIRRCLPGERAHNGVVGLGLAISDPACHPQGEDPRLARPGPGQYAHRLSWFVDGEAL